MITQIYSNENVLIEFKLCTIALARMIQFLYSFKTCHPRFGFVAHGASGTNFDRIERNKSGPNDQAHIMGPDLLKFTF